MECGSSAPAFAACATRNMTSTIANPLALIAELTHRCPFHCVYCSNPLELARATELSTDNWSRVFQEAAALGVLQADFPAANRSLVRTFSNSSAPRALPAST